MRRVDKGAFGARVSVRRAAKGLSQTALAQRVGMKQQGIVSIEKGEVARPRLLRELALALDTTEQWLLWKEGPEVVARSNAPGDTSEAVDSMLAIGARLRLIRIAYGTAQGFVREMSPAAMCRLTAIDKVEWERAEAGISRIEIDSAIKLARKTGVPLNYIYLGEARQLPHALAIEIAKLEQEPSRAVKHV